MRKTTLIKVLKFMGILIAIAGLIIGFQKIGIGDSISQALDWIDGLGAWGAIIFVLIYVAASMALISGAVLTLGAGTIFGVVQGSVLVSIASTTAAAGSFLVGRYLARQWVAKQIEKQPRFVAIDRAVAKEGLKIVGLVRLSPIFPFVFLNYAFGVTQVKFRDYLLASWVGMMPGTVMYVYIGSLGKLAAEGTGDTLRLILNIVGLIATIAVTVYVTKIAQKALKEEIETPLDQGVMNETSTPETDLV